MLNVYKAGTDDVKLLAALGRETFYDTYHAYNTAENMQLFIETNFNDEVINLDLRDEKCIYLIAEDDGIAAGYAKLSDAKNPFDKEGLQAIEICRIYAVKDMIGKGVGKELIKQCIETAKSLSKQILWLGVWSKNQRAIDFYTAQGFETFGEHVFMLGDDEQKDWLMKKKVS